MKESDEYRASKAAPRSRATSDTGAVIAETALVLPVLVIFALGLFEFGMVFHEKLVVERAVNDTARTITNVADGRMADYEGLRTFASATSSLKQATLRRVIVYKSSTANGLVPSSCLSVNPSPSSFGICGVSGLCNVYTKAQVDTQSPSGFPGTGSPQKCTAAAWDFNWCPSGQNPSGAPRNRSAPDYVGVYAEFDYQNLQSLFPVNVTLKSRAVFALEPPVTVGS